MTWWQRIFYGFNTTVKKEEPDPFIEGLNEKGFHYSEEDEWWERVWVVATKYGSERSKEVYEKKDGEWSVMMYCNEGDLFYKHLVNSEDND